MDNLLPDFISGLDNLWVSSESQIINRLNRILLDLVCSRMKKENEAKSGYEGVGRFYDLFADNADIPFFLESAKKYGSPILDIGAGTGRVSIALAQNGFAVVALEQSLSMLQVARDKLESESQDVADRVTIIEGDMTKFDLDQKFPLIIIPNSIGHAITTVDQIATLQCIRNHLTDTGIFILDLYPGEMQYEHAVFKENLVALPDGTTVERHGEIRSDLLRKIMTVNLQYIVRDNNQDFIEEVIVESPVALLFNREVDLLVQVAGFEIEKELGDFDGSPYSSECGHRILILKKSNEE